MIIKYSQNLLAPRLVPHYNKAILEDEFTQLYRYMDGKFKAIDDRLDQVATKAELKAELDQMATKAELNNHIKAIDRQFMRLFKYLDGRFKAIDDRYDQTNAKINIYVNAIDAFAKQSEIYMQEALACGLNLQV